MIFAPLSAIVFRTWSPLVMDLPSFYKLKHCLEFFNPIQYFFSPSHTSRMYLGFNFWRMLLYYLITLFQDHMSRHTQSFLFHDFYFYCIPAPSFSNEHTISPSCRICIVFTRGSTFRLASPFPWQPWSIALCAQNISCNSIAFLEIVLCHSLIKTMLKCSFAVYSGILRFKTWSGPQTEYLNRGTSLKNIQSHIAPSTKSVDSWTSVMCLGVDNMYFLKFPRVL